MSDYGKSIQLWPGGASLEYQGDPDGPAAQRRLRTPRRNNTPASDWRAGTFDEWRAIRIELRAENYQKNLIWHCDSSLVDDLIKASQEAGALEGFSYEDIGNLYRSIDEDTDAADLREYASDHGVDLPSDVLHTSCAICEADIEGTLCDPAGDVRRWLDRGGNWTGPAPVSERDPDAPEAETHYHAPVPSDLDSSEDDWLTEARDVCRDHAQDNPAEILEWWRVDPWLAQRLHEIGECVLDNGYGEWWGRTCSGQGLIMDGVLQRIARTYEQTADAPESDPSGQACPTCGAVQDCRADCAGRSQRTSEPAQ